jgi:hypothetical protein
MREECVKILEHFVELVRPMRPGQHSGDKGDILSF